MSKFRLLYTCVFLILSGFIAEADNVQTFQDEDMDIRTWIESNFRKGVVPPFSFELGDRLSDNMIGKWDFESGTIAPSQSGEIAYRFIWTDPVTGMKVEAEVKGYPDYDAVEWMLRFVNTSDKNSETLKNVKSADVRFRHQSGDCVLQYADGTHVSKADFHPRSKTITYTDGVYMSPRGGRSSDQAFPFFNIKDPNLTHGVLVAVGWTGTWYADISKISSKEVSLEAGMKTLETYLYPAEEIRTPSTCLLFWSGEDQMRGHNKFRRFMINIQAPKINGKPAVYPVSTSFNYGDPYPCNEYTCITETYALAMIERYKDYGLVPEVFWLDAGWYIKAKEYYNNKNWANTVGNWIVDYERFPNGLKPVSDAVHKAGAKFMLWFEPERVIKESIWGETMRGWMLDRKGSDSYLFDLGNPQALDWFCRYIGDFMQVNGIDYYRQDFNMDVDAFWSENDEPGRKGIREIRHIEGLYKFWEYLLKRFPETIVDNCASGGRRIDFETMKRSAPMWRTDYNYGEPLGYQTHTYGLSYYLPLTGTGVDKADRFSFRSSLGTSVIFNWKITEAESNLLEMQRCFKEFFEVRPYFYEDYYPLTTQPDMTSDKIWLAYQLHRPSDDTGYIVAFRREFAEQESVVVKLGGLVPSAMYELKDCDTGEEFNAKGSDLMTGTKLIIKNKRESKLLKYRRL